jgi:hypothetical protein
MHRRSGKSFARLGEAAPPYVIYSSPQEADVHNLPNRERLTYLHAWLLEHDAPFADVEGWLVYRREAL